MLQRPPRARSRHPAAACCSRAGVPAIARWLRRRRSGATGCGRTCCKPPISPLRHSNAHRWRGSGAGKRALWKPGCACNSPTWRRRVHCSACSHRLTCRYSSSRMKTWCRRGSLPCVSPCNRPRRPSGARSGPTASALWPRASMACSTRSPTSSTWTRRRSTRSLRRSPCRTRTRTMTALAAPPGGSVARMRAVRSSSSRAALSRRRIGTASSCPRRRRVPCCRSPCTRAIASPSWNAGGSLHATHAASVSPRCSRVPAAPARRWPPKYWPTRSTLTSSRSISPSW